MSAIASFTKFNAGDIEAIKNNTSVTTSGLILKKHIDQYSEYKKKFGEQLNDFEYSGWVYSDLLNYFENIGVNLFESKFKSLAVTLSKKRDSTILIIDYDLAQNFLNKTMKLEFSPAELLQFHNEFSGTTDDAEYGKIMVTAIKHLQSILELITKDSVVLFEIG